MDIFIAEKIKKIFLQQKRLADERWDVEEDISPKSLSLQATVTTETATLDEASQQRIMAELSGFGPLQQLLDDPAVCEILVNKFNNIYFEKDGFLHNYEDHFYSEQTYNACLERLSQLCNSYLNREKPFIEAQYGTWRITILFSELSRGSHLLSIRKQPKTVWTLQELYKNSWCTSVQLEEIKKIFTAKKNFLVVGGTGSGKTSFLQALLQDFLPQERAVIIEDTQELHPPNPTCCSLLTRQDPSGVVRDISMDDLLKRALRLRPDRLVIGEIRGAEARALLMALATGHDGSFGSMHARTAGEALMRLEMLIQMGAPEWSLHSIRNLMAMTLQNIFVVEKINGIRKLQGIYQLSSLEENGITIHRVDC